MPGKGKTLKSDLRKNAKVFTPKKRNKLRSTATSFVPSRRPTNNWLSYASQVALANPFKRKTLKNKRPSPEWLSYAAKVAMAHPHKRDGRGRISKVHKRKTIKSPSRRRTKRRTRKTRRKN